MLKEAFMYKTRFSHKLNGIAVQLLPLILGVIVSTSLNCAKDLRPSNNTSDPFNIPVTQPVTNRVMADSGATLSHPSSGLQLRLSPGALATDTTVTVAELAITEDTSLFEAAVRFAPEHTLLLQPCTVIVPLGKTYEGPKSLEIWESNDSDLSFALPSGRYADVLLSITGYVAVAQVVHFSSMGFSKVCHSGTIRRILEDFETRGCNRGQIFDRVNKKYPGVNLSNKNIETASPQQVQALLDTYFDDAGAWPGGTDVSPATIDLLTQQVKKGRSIVLAFGPAILGPRSGADNFYDCDVRQYRHTAMLQQATDGTVQIVNTVSVSKTLRS